MATVPPRDYARLKRDLPEIQAALAELGLDAWLLYDLHARNPVAANLIGMGDMSRRFFVVIPRTGDPVVLAHGIEEAPWAKWPWKKTVYVGWKPLEEKLNAALGGMKRVAMEYSDGDAVPAVDYIPAGVADLVRASGVQIVSSGDLVTRFYSRWNDEDLASHRRAAVILAQVANAQMLRLGRAINAGDSVTEVQFGQWVAEDARQHGLHEGVDCIPATGLNAADPHYAPIGNGATFVKGDVVLLDLWGKEQEAAIFADQTWMGYLGDTVPERIAQLFGVIRDARDAAVKHVTSEWGTGRPIPGGDLDDAARNVVKAAGYGEYFIHRTGHSIDREIHGMGPNIDNLETRETRLLIPRIGFSIEPGIYIPGDVGLRTEINVYIGENGPEVTTPSPQQTVLALLGS
ncbi:MAG TPA: Xaa-Pro peptidase family protein [Longimicrobiales bacterium]